MRQLLKGRFRHKARMLLNVISFLRMKSLSQGKKKSAKDLWSAGKSVETIHSIESATDIMKRLGQSLDHNPPLRD